MTPEGPEDPKQISYKSRMSHFEEYPILSFLEDGEHHSDFLESWVFAHEERAVLNGNR